MTMKPDSHITDILNTVYDPKEYVRRILANFIAGEFNKDEAVVRIGISGNGRAPHYCIEQGARTLRDPDSGRELGEKFEKRGIYHGRNHSPILEDQFKDLSWSSCTASYKEVETIFGRLRSTASKNN